MLGHFYISDFILLMFSLSPLLSILFSKANDIKTKAKQSFNPETL